MKINAAGSRKTIMTSFSSIRLKTAGLCLTGLFLLMPSAFAADYSSGVTAKVLTKTSVTGNGRKINYPRTDRAEVTAMTVDLAPGAETGWHMHPVPVYAYVISGNLTVELQDGKRFSFSAGDAVIEVVNTWHNGKNIGTEPVQLAVFYLGVEGEPNVIKQVLPEKTASNPDSNKHSH
jgi:quercetin dioxygenase-like cupin family protein